MNQQGTYAEYTTPITISQDTFVEAYSTYRGRVSSVVSETCEYSPVHHYENDYLTFKVISPGKIYWRSNGSLVRDIEYSLNNGTWTTLTSAATPPTITVAANDVIRFRGTNQSYEDSVEQINLTQQVKQHIQDLDKVKLELLVQQLMIQMPLKLILKVT